MVWRLLQFPKLTLVQYAEDYRGVETVGKARSEECILFVPSTMIITVQRAEQSAIGQAIARAVSNRVQLLCVFVCDAVRARSLPVAVWCRV